MVPSPLPREFELPVQLAPLLLDADGERVDAALGHETLAERLEDVLDVPRRQCAHPLSLPHVPLHAADHVDPHVERGLRRELLEPVREPPELPRAAEHAGGLALRDRAVRREVLEEPPHPTSGRCSSQPRLRLAADRARRGVPTLLGWRTRSGHRETPVDHAWHDVRLRPRVVDLDAAPSRRPGRTAGRRARTVRPPSRRSSRPRSGPRRVSGTARPEPRGPRARAARARSPGARRSPSVSLRRDLDRGLDAVHAGDALACPRA